MPTVLRETGYSFRFYSKENNEPPHIHIWGKGGQMKVWLTKDLEIAEVYNIPPHEQTKILKIIEKNKQKFLYEWFEFKKREQN